MSGTFETITITGDEAARHALPATGRIVRASVHDEMIVSFPDGRRFQLTQPPVRDVDGNLWANLDNAVPLPMEPPTEDE